MGATSPLPPLAGSSWLMPRAFPPKLLQALANEIDSLPLKSLKLVKAFAKANDADAAFASNLPAIQWVCENGRHSTGRAINDPTLTLKKSLQSVLAPMSARLATSPTAATPSLTAWLDALDEMTGRPYRDADVYLTAAKQSSASLGWHVDDIDVLLVMLRGRKRFRVAGRAVGSEVTIDHWMESGDAIYIPALNFHTGGDSPSTEKVAQQAAQPAAQPAEGSILLSVAIPAWPDADAQDAATDGVKLWRRSRDAIRRQLPATSCNSWQWAGSVHGRELVCTALGVSSQFAHAQNHKHV